MSLTTLASLLLAQANAGGAIVLDDSVLPAAALPALRTAFALGPGANLTIEGVSAADIVGPVDGILTIKAGTVSMFGNNGLAIGVAFSQPGAGIEAIIQVTMGQAWTFKQSFPSLDNFPFKVLDFSAPGIAVPQFVYTTALRENYRWPGYSSPPPVALSPGLWFFSQIDLGSLPMLGAILGAILPTAPVNFFGPFSPVTGQSLPIGKITASLGADAFTVGAGPNALHLNAPSIAFCITPAAPPLVFQRLQLLIECAFGQVLDIAIAIPARGKTFGLSAGPPRDRSTPVLSLIESLPGGAGFAGFIPAELATIFADIGLASFSMVADTAPSVKSISFAVTTLVPWPLIADVLVLENLVLKVSIIGATTPPTVQAWVSARTSFFPAVFPGDFDVRVGLQGPPYIVDSVSACYAGVVALQDLVKGLVNQAIVLPPALAGIYFSDFALSARRAQAGDPWSYQISGSMETAFSVLGTTLSSLLYVNVQHTAPSAGDASTTAHLAGGLVIGGQSFNFKLDLGGANSRLSASWEDDAEPLGFDSLAASLGFAAPPIPPKLDLGLKSATLDMDFSPETLVFTGSSVNYGQAALVAARDGAGTWAYIFGVDIGLDIKLNLSNIPLLGQLVPAGDDMLGLNNLRIVAATDSLPVYPGSPALSAILGDVVNSGMALGVQLQLGASAGQSFTLSFGGANPSVAGAPTPSRSAVAAPAGAGPAPQATWVDVQRAFGPMQIGRIGFSVVEGDQLALFIDGQLSLGGLTIGLTGLEAALAIHTPLSAPDFSLAGLQVQFDGAALHIGGGLQKVPGSSPLEYTGDLTLTVGNFGATAAGSYTTVAAQPSLFAFVFVDAPLGGPACFFVTGMAGGFGYNRSLQLPTIAGVATYPLVQGAMGVLNKADTLSQLDTYIHPQQNQHWFAAGVRFTSFEMVKSFALVTISFGTNVEIALMGESTLTVPVSTQDNPQNPVAEADLLILVDVQVTNGVVAVNAQLSPSSYVFSRAAQLTGGFAFYLWFGPSPYAGDYVVTLGGYNSYFAAPSYYPQVPRLGLNWQVSADLTVKGGLYFAITPSVIMAGGSLSATWQSGDIKAWFDAEADFLIRYKPFTYLIHVSISIGVSVRVDLWITSFTVTLHLGVDLTLWGPSFGGVAHISLYIVSFTLGFGSSSPPGGGDITWTEFRDTFLPKAQCLPAAQAPAATRQLRSAANATPTPTNSLITIAAPMGIIRTFSQGSASVWSVSAGTLEIRIATLVPSTEVTVAPTMTVKTSRAWTKQLGVGPMGAAAGAFATTLSITIDRDSALDDDDWTATAVLGSVPAGMWLNTSNAMQTKGTVDDVLLGLSLVPAPPGGESTLPVPIAALLADNPPVRNAVWSGATVPYGDSFNQAGAMTQMQSSLVDKTVAAARSNIIAALQKQGLATKNAVSVANFAKNAPNLLYAGPALRYLGEVPSI